VAVVAIDTQTLIYALKKPKNEAERELCRRSKLLFDAFADSGTQVIIPTVVIAEYLVGLDPARYGSFIAELQNRHICAPFDIRAACVAAELWRKHRRLPKRQQITRSTLKADVLVIATAKVAGADAIYSNDKKVRSLAEKTGLEGRGLPTHSENLFVYKASEQA